MLKRLENKDVSAVLSYLKDDAVSVRIKANLSVYGTGYDFAEFWAQYDESGKITAALSKINGACTLTFSDIADKEELCALLGFIPYASLFTDKDKAEALGLEISSSGDILCFCGDLGEYVGEGISDLADMKQVFALISENEGKSIARLDYLEWLSDITFKSNRDAARLKAHTENGELIAFAMTSCETDGAGIISGVFTKKEHRKRGYGETVLYALTHTLVNKGKKVYIMTAEEEMTAYYEKRGFEKISCWSEEKQ